MSRSLHKEQIISGSPENDFPVGDYVCLCLKCYHNFHGQRENKICYQCVMDHNNDLKNTYHNIYELTLLCTVSGIIGLVLGLYAGTVLGF